MDKQDRCCSGKRRSKVANTQPAGRWYPYSQDIQALGKYRRLMSKFAKGRIDYS